MVSEPGIPVLSWCGARIHGHDYANNDGVAFGQDLALIQSLGLRVLPLLQIVHWQIEGCGIDEPGKVVGLCWEGGTRFDFEACSHPAFGPQPGLLNLLREFRTRHPEQQQAHASVFALLSPQARAQIDRERFAGSRSWSDAAWQQWHAEGLCSLENGSWSHSALAADGSGFAAISDWRSCRDEIMQAAQHAHWITGYWPRLFAYPGGTASDYVRTRWFPDLIAEHRTLAAFGQQGQHLSRAHDRWNLPRYLCGTHWRSPEQLRELLLARIK